jgi:FkbM family methyltransferase
MRDWIARTAVKHSARLAVISRVPLLGFCVRVLGRLVVPPQSLVWTQIQEGAGKGLWMELYPRTAELFYHGAGEVCVQKFIVEHLKPGMVFYDLGTNLGFFSLIAARQVDVAGQVYGFEPDPQIAQRVRANLNYNGFKNFTLTESAVWRETGTVKFAQVDAASSLDRGTGQIAESPERERTISVPAIALDDFVKTARPPNLIKCDVEGAEFEALRGAASVLAGHHPDIVCEIHSPENGIAVRDLLLQLGYQVSDLDANHLGAEFRHK